MAKKLTVNELIDFEPDPMVPISVPTFCELQAALLEARWVLGLAAMSGDEEAHRLLKTWQGN